MIVHGARLIALVAGLALVPGCGPTRPPSGNVSGRVTLDGEPVGAGVISFTNDSIGVGASADLAHDGAYRINERLPAGDYQVSIRPPSPPLTEEELARMEEPGYRPEVPEQYQRAYSTRGLSATIEAGTNQVDFDL